MIKKIVLGVLGISIIIGVVFWMLSQKTQGVILEKKENPGVAIVMLEGSKVYENITSNIEIGCNDKIVHLALPLGKYTPEEILNQLFVFDNFDAQSGFYNVFDFSRNLKAESITAEGGVVTVALTGDLITSGMCDAPRVAAQIVETINHNFEGVEDVIITVNGVGIDELLSEK